MYILCHTIRNFLLSVWMKSLIGFLEKQESLCRRDPERSKKQIQNMCVVEYAVFLYSQNHWQTISILACGNSVPKGMGGRNKASSDKSLFG